MKGLLIKDFYMVWKYCRMVLILMIVFLVISATGEENAYGEAQRPVLRSKTVAMRSERSLMQIK